MPNSTFTELTTEQIARIIYNAGRELSQVDNPVTPLQPFDALESEIKALFLTQVEAIIENYRVRPHELQDKFKVTAEQFIENAKPAQNIIDKLGPYLLTFTELSEINKTKVRLQLQLARILVRHNRNVNRSIKWQRERQRIPARSMAKNRA